MSKATERESINNGEVGFTSPTPHGLEGTIYEDYPMFYHFIDPLMAFGYSSAFVYALLAGLPVFAPIAYGALAIAYGLRVVRELSR